MEITFVRHAEKEEGDEDLPISKKGIEQAKLLAKRLGKEKFDEFYCSDLKRAKETAAYVSESIKIIPKIEKSLNEFESIILKTKKKDWDKNSKKRYLELKSFLGSLTKRADEDKRILIISHGTTNRLILATLLELDLKNLIRFRQLETAINETYWMKKFGNWRLKYWNDVSHQPKELVEGKNKY